VLIDLSSRRAFRINDVGAQIWLLCDGSTTVEMIVMKIAEEFQVDKARARGDTLEFLKNLIRLKLVEMKKKSKPKL